MRRETVSTARLTAVLAPYVASVDPRRLWLGPTVPAVRVEELLAPYRATIPPRRVVRLDPEAPVVVQDRSWDGAARPQHAVAGPQS